MKFHVFGELLLIFNANFFFLYQFLLGLSSGTHLNSPMAEMIPVTAFRLEPLSAGGYLTVDGEVVDYGPLQAEVMPSLARILSR